MRSVTGRHLTPLSTRPDRPSVCHQPLFILRLADIASTSRPAGEPGSVSER
jgi:hypothetical protein